MQLPECPSSGSSSQEIERAAKRKLSQSYSREDHRISPSGGPSTSQNGIAPSATPITPKKPKMVQPPFSQSPTSTMTLGIVKGLGSDVAAPAKISQAHTGIRRLVIKNLKKPPSSKIDEHYAKSWTDISEALEATLAGRRPRLPLDRLYRYAEDICRNNQGEELFHHLKKQCTSYLQQSLLPELSSQVQGAADAIRDLRVLLGGWKMWSVRSRQIRSMFGFLDRAFLFSSKKYPQLNDMAINLYREVICEQGQFGARAYNGMCELVNADRLGLNDIFDSSLLSEAVMMLHVMDLYKPGFEAVFLESSQDYLHELDTKTWTSLVLKEYAMRCIKFFDKEGERCDAYNFDSATKRALLTNGRNILVVERVSRLLDEGQIGSLLEAVDIDGLKALYSLLHASGLQDRLKGPWEAYIKRTGLAIVGDQAKGDDMVVRLLELKRSLELLIRDAFDKDESFRFAMREAYSNFINDRKSLTAWSTGNSKVGEVIAKYIDLLLRGGLKAVPRSLASDAVDRQEAEKRGEASTGDEEAELDRQLEQGIELFRFIEGKDVFEAFYKQDLARRLLMGRSASQDAERSMLTKLKSECGSNFTHNLEQMFKDQELSRDEMASYKEVLGDDVKAVLDLQVNVLSAAAWPTYPDVKVNLPPEVAKQIEKYDRHYKHKHTGRRLTWKHALAHSVVKAKFPKATKELVVSGFQAIVLLLFNDLGREGHLSYDDIQKATGLVDAELQRTLQSLACAKVRPLNKHPKGRDINPTDTFTINESFSDPKYRIKINQIQLKESTEENKETHERVALDRQYETQAAIVRIMKSRKTMSHGNLVAEVINQTKSRGAVEMSEIKKNIEKLIEKDYMERDGSNYVYIA